VVLDGRDRPSAPRLLDDVDPDLGQPDLPDRSAIDVSPDRAEAVLERRLRIDPVEV